MESQSQTPLVGIIMGSKSDWEVMRLASETLIQLGIANECRVISAHRAPDALLEYVSQAENRHHRRSWRGRAFTWRHRCKNHVTGFGLSDAIQSTSGTRLIIINCSNAQRHSRGYPRDR